MCCLFYGCFLIPSPVPQSYVNAAKYECITSKLCMLFCIFEDHVPTVLIRFMVENYLLCGSPLLLTSGQSQGSLSPYLGICMNYTAVQ